MVCSRMVNVSYVMKVLCSRMVNVSYVMKVLWKILHISCCTVESLLVIEIIGYD